MNKPVYRMSEAETAKRGSPEWKENIRQGVICHWNSLSTEEQAEIINKQNLGKKGHKKPEHWKQTMSVKYTGVGNPNYGKRHSSETKQQMSISQKVSCLTSPVNFANLPPDKLIEIIGTANKARQLKGTSQKTRMKLSLAARGTNNPFYGRRHTEETKAKLRQKRKEATAKGLKYGFANMTKEQLQEINRRTIAKSCARPNKTELELLKIINEACPHQYKYTGDASVKIAGLYPDFFNIDGKKKIIEMFGNYYHSEELTQQDWRATELGRIMTYNSYGFDCLVIWESDLKTKGKEKLIELIKEFNRSKKCKHAPYTV